MRQEKASSSAQSEPHRERWFGDVEEFVAEPVERLIIHEHDSVREVGEMREGEECVVALGLMEGRGSQDQEEWELMQEGYPCPHPYHIFTPYPHTCPHHYHLHHTLSPHLDQYLSGLIRPNTAIDYV